MTREELLDKLAEPLHLMSESDLAHAEKLALSDREVALSLRHSKALSGFEIDEIVGEPLTSDAEFLTALREKLEPKPALIDRLLWQSGLFGRPRLLAVAATLGVLLVVAVFGIRSGGTLAPVWWITSGQQMFSYDELYLEDDASADLDYEALAYYMDVSDVVDDWNLMSYEDTPLTDLWLTLEAESQEEVLKQFAETSFF